MATTTRRTYKKKTTTDEAPEVKWEQVLEHALTVPGSTGNV